MLLKVERKWLSDKATIGLLTIDDANECFTLEDVVRSGPKVYGETAIPAGTYNVVITPSKRFGRDLPLVESVPNFEGVRIHPGNTAADTDGCLLVGTSKGADVVFESRKAFDALFTKIKAALDRGEKVTLEIG